MMVFHRNLLLKSFIFRFHVSFPGCINFGEPGSPKKNSMVIVTEVSSKKVSVQIIVAPYLPLLTASSTIWILVPDSWLWTCHVERNDCWWFRNLANHWESIKPCNTVNNGTNYQPQLVGIFGINYQPQLVSWSRISGCHQNSITWTWITKKGLVGWRGWRIHEDWNPTLCCYLDIHGSS